MAQQIQQTLFFVLAGVAIIAALGVIFNRNAVHSALSLLVNFGVLAVFYLLLNAQFIGVVQVAVYAGAIVVLFLFVVMLLGAGGKTWLDSWFSWRTALVVAVALVLLTFIGTAVFELPIRGESGSATPQEIARVGQTQALGAALFTQYLLPFEMASVLLLVGMLGAIVLGQRWRGTLDRPDQPK
jgi:NADH-quinone oxidoreductase subunit J